MAIQTVDEARLLLLQHLYGPEVVEARVSLHGCRWPKYTAFTLAEFVAPVLRSVEFVRLAEQRVDLFKRSPLVVKLHTSDVLLGLRVICLPEEIGHGHIHRLTVRVDAIQIAVCELLETL